jgi:hypothetical protein
MENAPEYHFSEPVTIFQGSRLPERATPVGYAALIDAHGLKVPMPRTLSAIGPRHKEYEQDGWHIYTPRHAPMASLEGHLTFALKYEGLDLLVLKSLFQATGPEPIEAIVKATLTGTYARRVWFLYEWLLGKTLDLPSAEKGVYADVVDTDLQWTAPGKNSTRHRVKNNLPGTPSFCPMIFQTTALRDFAKRNLSERAREVVAEVPADVLARTAAFLLLKDSRSSFEIEGEYPPQERIQNWGRAIGEAGRQPIDLDELLRLQRIVIGDDRFVPMGLRNEGGFVGDRDRDSGMPLPVHVSARHSIATRPRILTRFLPPRFWPSDLSIFTRSPTATDAYTAILSTTFWRNAASIRPAWSFRFPQLSSIASTITVGRSKVTRDACSRLSNGSPRTKGTSAFSTTRRITTGSSTRRRMRNFCTNALPGRSTPIFRRKRNICRLTTRSNAA